jgi:hypothetical protein
VQVKAVKAQFSIRLRIVNRGRIHWRLQVFMVRLGQEDMIVDVAFDMQKQKAA